MEKFIGIREACEIMDLSTATIKRYVSIGAIPSYKIGKRRLFVAEQLIEWAEKQKELEPPLVLKFKWCTIMEKWIEKLEETFQDAEKIEKLTFHEKLRLFEQISDHMNRTLNFALKYRNSVPEAIESFYLELKQRRNLAPDGYAC